MENPDSKIESTPIKTEDLFINFSGDGKSSSLCISAKDCHKVPAVLETLLKASGIDCHVVVPPAPSAEEVKSESESVESPKEPTE